jgi:5-formyltetrahydrofolate cyclo-ligase
MKSLKAVLREKVLATRNALAPQDINRCSLLAQKRIIAEEIWQQASSVALYAATRHEAQTGLLLEQAWQSAKQVYLPRVESAEQGVMSFALCRGNEQLITGSFGIPEPDPRVCPVVDFLGKFPDVFIIPGVAFDRCGHRLGMGGGYYDRFLAAVQTQNIATIGLSFAFQVLDEIPAAALDSWDKNVSAICTEQEFLWIN